MTKRKSGWLRIAVAAALLLVLLAAWGLLGFPTGAANARHAEPGQGGAAQKPPPLQVGVIEVVPRDQPYEREHLAQTSASRTIEVRARVTGLLLERNFEEGARVSEGQVLFQIDPRPFEARMRAAEAQLVEAQARLEEAERGVARKQQLVAADALPARELEDAGTAQTLASAQVSMMRAELDMARLDLEYTQVRAPIEGRVGKVVRDQGSLVDALANSVLTTVSALDPIYASFRISERELLEWEAARRDGSLQFVDGGERLPVALSLIDGTPWPAEGRINYRALEVDSSTGTAEVRAEFPNPDEGLLPGQFVRARVLGVVRRGVITVPQAAVQMGPAASFVYVLGAGDTVEPRNVVTSRWEGADWVIESGLAAGDRVIVDGLQKLHPGAVVQPVAAAKKP